MSDVVLSEKVVSDDPLKELRDKLDGSVEYFRELKTMGEGKAFRIIIESEETDKLITALLSIQGIFGIIISLDPESIYAPQFKQTSGVYEKINVVAEQTSKLIDEAFSIWQEILSNVHPFTRSPRYCYKLLTTKFAGTKWSFHGILLQIMSNCEKIKSFLTYLYSGEVIKAELGRLRSQKLSKTYESEVGRPPSLEVKDEPKEGENV